MRKKHARKPSASREWRDSEVHKFGARAIRGDIEEAHAARRIIFVASDEPVPRSRAHAEVTVEDIRGSSHAREARAIARPLVTLLEHAHDVGAR